MGKKEVENLSANILLIEKAKEFIVAPKHQMWEDYASTLDERTLSESVKIMEMLSSGISDKAANKEVNKIKDKEVKAKVVKTVTNYAKGGPEFALERVKKANGGKIDRTNEYVDGLFYKMDENTMMSQMER